MKTICVAVLFCLSCLCVTTTARSNFRWNEEKRIYVDDHVIPVEFDQGVWQVGERIPSKFAEVGNHYLWTKGDVPGEVEFQVVKLYHQNVSATKSDCCWSVELGFPACEYKYCCGSGCCC